MSRQYRMREYFPLDRRHFFPQLIKLKLQNRRWKTAFGWFQTSHTLLSARNVNFHISLSYMHMTNSESNFHYSITSKQRMPKLRPIIIFFYLKKKTLLGQVGNGARIEESKLLVNNSNCPIKLIQDSKKKQLCKETRSRYIIPREYVHNQLRQGAKQSSMGNYYIFKSLSSCMLLTHWRINRRTITITSQSEALWFEPLESHLSPWNILYSSGKSYWLQISRESGSSRWGTQWKKMLTSEI